MACRTLDITLIKAKDLPDVNLFTRMEVYAVLSISGDPRTRQRTVVDSGGLCNPTWKQTFRFTIPADDPGHLALHVLLRSERILGDRDVGEVYITLRDLLPSADGEEVLRYQVHNTNSGKAHGYIFLSCKVGDPVVDPAAAPNSLVRPAVAKPAGNPPPPVKPRKMDNLVMEDELVIAYPPPYPQPSWEPYPQQTWAPYPPEAAYPGYPPPQYAYAEPPVKGRYRDGPPKGYWNRPRGVPRGVRRG